MHHETSAPHRSQRINTSRRPGTTSRPNPMETADWATHDFLVMNQRPDLLTTQPNPPQPCSHRGR